MIHIPNTIFSILPMDYTTIRRREKGRILKRSVYLFLLLFFGTVFFCGLSFYNRSFPAVQRPEGHGGVSEPSGEFALFHVRKLASFYFQGRAPGTKGGYRAARYLAEWFQKSGLKPGGEGGTYYQTVLGPCFKLAIQENRWKPQISGEKKIVSENVLGFLGDEAGAGRGVVILSAHYDHLGALNGNFFPGANDNASGLGVLLEVARVLGSRPDPPRHRILFAAWTFEEEGLYGSTFFASTYPADKVKAVINLDSLGTGEAREFLLWTHQQKNPLAPLVTGTGEKLGLRLSSRVLPSQTPHTSDHQPFAERGVPAVTILSPNWLEKNHTLQDVEGEINAGKLENAARLVVRVVEKLAY